MVQYNNNNSLSASMKHYHQPSSIRCLMRRELEMVSEGFWKDAGRFYGVIANYSALYSVWLSFSNAYSFEAYLCYYYQNTNIVVNLCPTRKWLGCFIIGSKKSFRKISHVSKVGGK